MRDSKCSEFPSSTSLNQWTTTTCRVSGRCNTQWVSYPLSPEQLVQSWGHRGVDAWCMCAWLLFDHRFPFMGTYQETGALLRRKPDFINTWNFLAFEWGRPGIFTAQVLLATMLIQELKFSLSLPVELDHCLWQ